MTMESKPNNIDALASQVGAEFTRVFGRSSLKERIADILREVDEMRGAAVTSVPALRGEVGDTLASLLAMCHENGWLPSELLAENSDKIRRREVQYRSLGRKLKVAVYGGAFDPPTLGHIRAAKLVLDFSGEFDEVWLMPAYGHLSGKAMLPFDERVAMCELAAKADPRIKVSTFEGDNKLGGDTYQMVKLLLDDPRYADTHNFSLMVGQDNANTMHKWPNHEYLSAAIRHVVVPRGGVEGDLAGAWYMERPHVYIVPEGAAPLTVSSSQVRGALKRPSADLTLAKLMDPAVIDYINEHNLYR